MPFVHVEELSFDDVNLDKLAEHGVSARQVRQLLDDPFLVLPNRRNRRAPYLLLGRDHGGACLAVPIEPTDDPGGLAPGDCMALQGVRERYPYQAWTLDDDQAGNAFAR